MGPFNFGLPALLGGAAVAGVGGFLFGTQFVAGGVVKDAARLTTGVIERAWQEHQDARSEKINLWNEVVFARTQSAEFLDLLQNFDKVTGEAKEQLRAELERRDKVNRNELQKAEALADELRKIKSQWGDQPIPDAYVCRMRGDQNCGADPDAATAAGGGDRVAVRN
jgi:hypothetical protein